VPLRQRREEHRQECLCHWEGCRACRRSSAGQADIRCSNARKNRPAPLGITRCGAAEMSELKLRPPAGTKRDSCRHGRDSRTSAGARRCAGRRAGGDEERFLTCAGRPFHGSERERRNRPTAFEMTVGGKATMGRGCVEAAFEMTVAGTGCIRSRNATRDSEIADERKRVGEGPPSKSEGIRADMADGRNRTGNDPPAKAESGALGEEPGGD
jgi:hypothetical protein